MTRAYFDHAATTPMREEARRILAREPVLGNASSVHAEGRAARALLDEARALLSDSLGVSEDEIVFTGSGTESDNLALRGAVAGKRGLAPFSPHVVTGGIEHEAVRRTLRDLADRGEADVTTVAPTPDGVVEAEAVAAALREDTALVTLMAVNNEIGTIQPVVEVAKRRRGALLHVDAVQAPGRVAVRPLVEAADLVSFSAHKAGGPAGVGVLVVKRGVKLRPPVTGGEQEHGLRPGTENPLLILAAAHALAATLAEPPSAAPAGLTRRLEEGLLRLEGVAIHGAGAPRAPGFTNAAFVGCDAVALVQALDLAGFAVSSGSACSSGSVRPSHVLEAMGLPEARCRSSVRFSLGPGHDGEDVDRLLAALPGILARLRRA